MSDSIVFSVPSVDRAYWMMIGGVLRQEPEPDSDQHPEEQPRRCKRRRTGKISV